MGSRLGISVPDAPQRNAERGQILDHKRELRRILPKSSARLYRSILLDSKSGESARSYLMSRGVSEETQKKYFLGYAPDSWEFIQKRAGQLLANTEGASKSQGADALTGALCQLGLLKRRENKNSNSGSSERASFYDAFRSRIVFPITRSDGEVIAFGARALKENSSGPKYINSPESPIYSKRRSLYGLSQALEQIRRQRHVYFVEGYMDVLAMNQKGVENCVASCGTAISSEHVQVLRRLVDRVTLVFDGDQAGRKAAGRCFEVFQNSGIELDAVLMPENEDPDSLGQSLPPREYLNFLTARLVGAYSIFLEELSRDLAPGAPEAGEPGSSNPATRGKLAARIAETLSKVQNPVEREVYIAEAARLS